MVVELAGPAEPQPTVVTPDTGRLWPQVALEPFEDDLEVGDNIAGEASIAPAPVLDELAQADHPRADLEGWYACRCRGSDCVGRGWEAPFVCHGVLTGSRRFSR